MQRWRAQAGDVRSQVRRQGARPGRATSAAVVLAVALGLLSGCASAARQRPDDAVGSTASPTTAGPPSTSPTTATPTTASPTTTAPPSPPGATDARAFLAPLRIDDQPSPGVRYDRDDWGGWADIDGDGCNGRQQALIASSISPAQVDPYGCTVVAGDWLSAYDGVATSDPSDLDVDHLVALSDAHTSGGWQWSAARRRQYANDPLNLWPVSASSNRSKGDKGPHEWRPRRTEVWCDYAIRWVQVKVGWGLTATTPERDALGSMLSDCAALPPPPVAR